jgi:hypothetical protein
LAVFQAWSFGVLEFWSLGILEFWSFGVLTPAPKCLQPGSGVSSDLMIVMLSLMVILA